MIPAAQILAHLYVLVVALLCTALVQLLSVRLCAGKIGVVGSLFLGFAAGLVVLLAGEVLVCFRGLGLLADGIALGLANFVLFVCCWYFYFHFINIGEASLRIRVLREAARVSGRPLEDLLAVYNVRTVVETRMLRLVQDGQLVVSGDRYCAGKPRMVLVAKAFAALRWLLLGEVSRNGKF
jgi:hypothetical protein